ncbi:hypothetical protein BLNAU_20751 [Blattamonas nauphoetae]|uniref:Uncharacterized protein n=1 Tax=Blattamonas nauphoetae TaxID=2049346 RepID=A0ABQ9X113_9EUKA|nr:hypothetical protein BLNAU_20751 [Blattamonas nauphoetae]
MGKNRRTVEQREIGVKLEMENERWLERTNRSDLEHTETSFSTLDTTTSLQHLAVPDSPSHHPPTTLSPTSALLCRKPSTLHISILTPPRLVHSHTHFTLLSPSQHNRLISQEIDIGVTAFITETTPLRKEGRRKEKRCPSVFLAFGSPPVPTPTSMLTPSPPSHSQKLTPCQARSTKLVCFTIFGALTPDPNDRFFSDSRWKDVELSNVPRVLERGLVSPTLSCSAEHSSSRHLRSLPPINLNSLSLSSVLPLSPSASNSSDGPNEIEMEEWNSNLNGMDLLMGLCRSKELILPTEES